MDYRTSKRSLISFGSYQRPVEQFQNAGGAGIHQRQSPLIYNTRSSLEQQSHSTCCYEHNSPLFALDWSVDDRVAIGSYKEDSFNKLSILESTPDLLHWENAFQANVIYPISKIQWMPKNGSRLATCSDSLRIWSADGGVEEQINLSLVKYGKNMGEISNARTLGQLPPVASFDWNTVDTNIILSSSIDTTCTIWDLQASNYVKTQLIAHDSEVFDAKFLTQSSNLFASCGGDGSVRVFDLRFLAHSTIIYEPQRQAQAQTPSQAPAPLLGQTQDGSHRGNNGQQYRVKAPSTGSSMLGMENHALLRLAPSPFDANILATIQQDSNVVIILDMRYPGSPILTLDGHMSAINQIQWHPSKPNILISCGDDCQILYWDVMDWVNGSPVPSSTPQRWSSNNAVHSLDAPQMSYTAQYEINNIVWRPKGDWLGYVAGKHFRNLKV